MSAPDPRSVATFGTFGLPPDAVGLTLHRVKGEMLMSCEPCIFSKGVKAVDMVLRRASLAGNVGPVGETGDQWADIVIDDMGTWTDTIALSPGAWKSLKTHWMRCRYAR